MPFLDNNKLAARFVRAFDMREPVLPPPVTTSAAPLADSRHVLSPREWQLSVELERYRNLVGAMQQAVDTQRLAREVVSYFRPDHPRSQSPGWDVQKPMEPGEFMDLPRP